MSVYSIPLVVSDSMSVDSFRQTLADFIQAAPENCIVVLPEYCWGQVSESKVLALIDDIQDLLLPSQQMVLGSLATTNDGITHNSAIYINGAGLTKFYPKRNVLDEEVQRHEVVAGVNPGPVKTGDLTVQTVICADLWNTQYLLQLLATPVDLLLVPAFTAVPKGLGSYARVQWYSLAITRSREFIVPMVIADHPAHYDSIDVGQVSCIVDPSLKHPSMATFEDFLKASPSQVISYSLDLSAIRAYRAYRLEKGLYQVS